VSVWFTSDLHFGHRFVAGLRGFEDPDEHDAHLVEQWTRRVGKHDQVWVLGDLAVSSPTRALDLVQTLPGVKHLIAGNHDGCHPMHRDSHRQQAKYLSAFASVQAFARRRIDGTEVMLSHFPYVKDRGEARYMQYRLRDEGAWLLHGHTHGPERQEGREIHVGVDAWDFAPVPIHTVGALINDR
jgi:calcineurin-like phosphoesterase family protein